MTVKEQFTTFLATRNLRGRSAADVLSRLNRVRALLDIGAFKNEREAIYHLESIHKFDALSTTVKSQLRRAIKLYFAFSINRNN
jgi:hypothetical protein